MSEPEIAPRFATEIARQKDTAFQGNALWMRRFWACSIASVILGLGVWLLGFPEPMDRDWGTAGLMVASAWLAMLCLLSLFGSPRSDPKCPRCGTAWVEEDQVWPTWKHCPGCGLNRRDDAG